MRPTRARIELTFQVASRMGSSLGRGADAPRLAVMAASTPELENDRQALIRLIQDEAVFHGDFTLSSGKKAMYYVDMRKLTLDHRAAPAIGRIMLDLISDIPDVVAVGGLTLGADPIANAIMHESARTDRPLDAFVVRKEPKDHGRGRQIEGADVEGRRVVVVEDTSTTGQSALKAVEALRKAGAEVVAVAVIVDRSTGAQAAIEAEGLEWRAAIGLADLGLDPQ
ncbi:orotate phosphoribosyltransferase [Microbacterium lacusdiani]